MLLPPPASAAAAAARSWRGRCSSRSPIIAAAAAAAVPYARCLVPPCASGGLGLAPHAARPASAALLHQQAAAWRRRQLLSWMVHARPLFVAASAGRDGPMSPEEEAAYAEFAAKRKAEQDRQREEGKRRRTFNPLKPRRAPAPRISPADAPAELEGAAAGAFAAGGGGDDPRAGAPPDPDVDAALAALLADGAVPEVDVLPDDDDALAEALRARTAAEAAAEAAQRRQRVSVQARRRRLTPAQIRAAALAKSQLAQVQQQQQQQQQRGMQPLPGSPGGSGSSAATRNVGGPPEAASLARAGSGGSSNPSDGGLASAGSATADPEQLLRELVGGDDGDDDDLDWDALGRFEEFEEAARREAAAQAAAAARRQRAAQASAAPAAQQPKPAQRKAAPPKPEPGTALDRDIAELEGLLGFFEAAEGAASSATRRQQQQRGGGGGGPLVANVGGALDAEDVDWAGVERALLGEGWEDALLAELEAELGEDDDGDGDGEAAGGGDERTGDDGGDAFADGGEPWADDITTLLLGLVEASHAKYLERPLLDAAVSEDERAAAVRGAPFALLVLDDSRTQQLEYTNAAAEALFGRGFLELFGTAGHELVAPDAAAQAEWAFALRDAAESPARRAVVARLKLAGAGGRAVSAYDVDVFQVDSLEGTPVGQAVVIRRWEQA